MLYIGCIISSSALFFSNRFFLMYLINKDETEHTGQVGVILRRSTYFVLLSPFLFPFSSFSVPVGILCVENVPGALLGFLPSW